ncbi:MAG TPA: T9SS type A sorting domain-containing protein [Bacteroidia bacterium]|jgi:hypothetical protein|nr:T9SS type A sorting domain-containing protein [Bacteroidia bacterium]
MTKHLLSISLLFLGLNVFSQSFSAMYPFTSVVTGSANTGTVDPTPPPTAAGITFGSFSAVGTSTAPAAGGVFCFTGWDATISSGNDAYATYTGAINPAKYYEVTITPNSSTVTLNSITFNISRSSAGPRNWAVRSDRSTFANNILASVVGTNTNINVQTNNVFFWALDSYTVVSGKQEAGSTITLSGPNYLNQTLPTAFRFYAWNAESGAGTFRIDTVRFSGTVSGASGIAEYTQDLNSAFKIYPNPSNDGIIYLETKKIIPIAIGTKIEVVNILGSTIAIENKEAAASEKIKLDLNTLPSGTYFVRVTSGNKVYSERFFITK